MPNACVYVRNSYVDEAVSFLHDHASFFAASIVDQGFQDWSRKLQLITDTHKIKPQSYQLVQDMRVIDAVMREMLDMAYSDELCADDFQFSLGLTEAQCKELLDLANLEVKDYWEYRQCLIKDNSIAEAPLFKAFVQAMLASFSFNGSLGLFYGNKATMTSLLSKEPLLVSRVLCLKASPVFANVYQSWVDSNECSRFFSHFKEPEKIPLLANFEEPGEIDLRIKSGNIKLKVKFEEPIVKIDTNVLYQFLQETGCFAKSNPLSSQQPLQEVALNRLPSYPSFIIGDSPFAACYDDDPQSANKPIP